MSGDGLPDEGQNALVRGLKRTVVKVIEDGVGPITGSVAYAEARLAKAIKAETADTGVQPPIDDGLRDQATADQIERVIKRLIKESVIAASANGFITGLGGFVTLPVAIPANVAGALVINARLVGAIAYLRGYDLRDPHVQMVATLATTGSSLAATLQGLGIKIAEKLTLQMIKAIPIAVIRKINTRVGFMLLAKYGTQRALITLGKGVPIVGGVVGAGVDATLTRIVGQAAKASFPADI